MSQRAATTARNRHQRCRCGTGRVQDHGDRRRRDLGTLTLGSDGTYTYSVSSAAVQYRQPGQSSSGNLAIQSVDGTTQQVTFTINGADDSIAPVLLCRVTPMF